MPMRQFGNVRLPWPRRAMWIAGIGAAFLLISVPLSYTFPNVSIPTVQLLMRGDVLLVAPIVDLLTGRRVSWYSWIALFLVSIGMAITIGDRGNFDFPPLLITIVILYTIGYLIRLAVMTKIAKTEDQQSLRQYFVEERLVSIPLSIGALALVAIFSDSEQGRQLAWGFTQAWTSDALPLLLVIGLALFLITIFAALVLLDKHENSYCVPLERSASILAGLAAVFILAWTLGSHYPNIIELISAALLITAITILTLGPKFSQRTKASDTDNTSE
jgi:drug/metabolite transporter (DMT)-like permease